MNSNVGRYESSAQVQVQVMGSGLAFCLYFKQGKRQDLTPTPCGFSIPNGFSSKLVPTLSFSCELLDEKGKQIFIASDSVIPLGNPVDGVPVEALKDPKVIQRLWKAAAQSIARKVISQL